MEDIQEIEKKEITEEVVKIRRGGKQASGLAPLKHSNFYFQFDLGLKCDPEQVKQIIIKLSGIIDEKLLILQGSEQGEKQFCLPRKDTREKLKLRISGKIRIRYIIEQGPQTGKFYLHYLYSVSKRGLDTQIESNEVRKVFNELMGYECAMKFQLFRDAKFDLNAYASKNTVI
jgi:hypothetical protein